MKNQDNSTICSLDYAAQRVRELEMELAKAKVSQVESECQNQTLQHQLNSLKNTNNPSASTPNSWKLKWDNVVNNINPSVSTFQSHITDFAHMKLNTFDEAK